MTAVTLKSRRAQRPAERAQRPRAARAARGRRSRRARAPGRTPGPRASARRARGSASAPRGRRITWRPTPASAAFGRVCSGGTSTDEVLAPPAPGRRAASRHAARRSRRRADRPATAAPSPVDDPHLALLAGAVAAAGRVDRHRRSSSPRRRGRPRRDAGLLGGAVRLLEHEPHPVGPGPRAERGPLARAHVRRRLLPAERGRSSARPIRRDRAGSRRPHGLDASRRGGRP